jgi:aminobenzoyl-glutamate utilization protein B
MDWDQASSEVAPGQPAAWASKVTGVPATPPCCIIAQLLRGPDGGGPSAKGRCKFVIRCLRGQLKMTLERVKLSCLGIIPIFWTLSAAGAQPEALKRAAIHEVALQQAIVDEIASTLWTYSETALRESRSAAFLIDKLRAAGFRVDSSVAGMDTAFVAEFGQGAPVIGVLAEFDALPGVGNATVPRRQPRSDGITAGHGCGHNLFAAASVGGAIALSRVVSRAGLPGTIRLFGTPAEETLVGKVYMAKAGFFNGLDAVIDWHPGTETRVRNQPGRAMNNFEVEFFGQSAHSSSDPWNGRSALDAVELMNHAVNLMREHIKPTARIHYVIPAGGEAPNVVPEYARVWYYVRDINRDEVEKHYGWILKIAEAAAMATQTSHKTSLITAVPEYLLNRPLQEAMQKNLELVGPVQFSEEEQEFARALQSSLGLEPKGFDAEIKPLSPGVDALEGGSTDVAEVSYLAPTAAFEVTTAAADIPWHSWATTACHGTSAGRRAALVAAKLVATTGIDLLTDADLIQEARAFFLKATGGKVYASPVPAGQAAPLPRD